MDKINNFISNLKNVNPFDLDYSQFVKPAYLFETNIEGNFIYEQWFYLIFLVNFIIGLSVFFLISKKFFSVKPKYRFFRKFSFAWISNSIMLLLYALFRSENIRFFSMRIFMVLILLGFIVIFVYAIIYWISILPKKMKAFEEAKMRSKYLKKRK